MSLFDIGLNITKLTSSYRFKLIIQAFDRWLKKDIYVLDIGCGNGIITNLLKNSFSVRIVGCDIKNYLVFDIPFKKLSNQRLPFKQGVFDVALLNDVLHHIDFQKQEYLIDEATRVAKRVLIFDAEPTIFGKIADIVLNKYHYGNLNIPLAFRDLFQWQQLFRTKNLKFQFVKLQRPFWYPFSHIAFELRRV